MSRENILLIPNGDAAITIVFDEPISESLSQKIIYLSEKLKLNFEEQIIEVIPAYQSLTVCFHPLAEIRTRLQKSSIAILNDYQERPPSTQKVIEIPVCYEEAFAPDIKKVAERCGLTINEVIRLHSEPVYLVHMLGFTPGFLYLGGLDQRLYCQRKATPATRVPAGSVGIGGTQTGIYPQSTPGGWQIIGRTPLQLFTPNQKNAYVAEPLAKIKFSPISEKTFAKLQEVKE
ncbi:5-oxoprolinase subunit PxpB [Aliikangiella marina]|uniref:5-oxoprolinase subunit PxpB n=1 Tax=Aliikangiella marina TaxID=1712262 RepID=A0A545T6K8_9GAMM|nr:5-oxoprolinase subunit PxpB [Aliikangiella marina]TQV72853.1 5-oxoprolinase subunit PxpB [Aliikangiella marina]